MGRVNISCNLAKITTNCTTHDNVFKTFVLNWKSSESVNLLL